jgi:hypothetical protein
MQLRTFQRFAGVQHMAHKRRPQCPPRADKTMPQKNAAPCVSSNAFLLVYRINVKVRTKCDCSGKYCTPVRLGRNELDRSSENSKSGAPGKIIAAPMARVD